MQIGEFEGHITLDLTEAREHLDFVKIVGLEFNLHYSEIAGWDELRPGHHAFLTGHSHSMADILARMQAADDTLNSQSVKIKVKRIKVELCVYDERFK